MAIETKPAIVNPDTGYVVPFGEAVHTIVPDGQREAEITQQELARHIEQDWRNHADITLAAHPRLQEAVAAVMARAPLDLSKGREGLTAFYEEVSAELIKPEEGMSKDLQDIQLAGGWY
jgi:hypothetical protein